MFKKLLIISALIVFTNNAFAAWSPPDLITEVFTEGDSKHAMVFLKLENGGYAHGCTEDLYRIVYSANATNEVSIALTAFAAGKNISLQFAGCDHLGRPMITAIKALR